MENDVSNASVTFQHLDWDTNFFGVTCAKVTLHNRVSKKEWDKLSASFKDYQFVTIENRESEPENAQFIGTHLNAFLADVNVQFNKNISSVNSISDKVEIYQGMDRNESLIGLANFTYSRFIEDTELLKRNGSILYQEWLINSFGKKEKNFIISKNDCDEIDGFLLYSYTQENKCTIELIAVDSNMHNYGVGGRLVRALENDAYRKGVQYINVGTQIRNTPAINFYHKCGFRQIQCNQIYHLWNR